MKTDRNGDTRRSIDGHLRIATVAAAALILGCGGWAMTTELSGAVLASGQVVVDANVKKVQHPFGGIVGRINVRNGQSVSKGDVLLSLDPTVSRANLAVITKNLDALEVRQGRLEAERDGRAFIRLPAELVDRLKEGDLALLLQTERRFFEMRRSARLGLRSQLDERISQFKEQIGGLVKQVDAYSDGVALIQQELRGLEKLYSDRLVAITRLMQLRREEADIRGKHAQALAEIAQAKGRIAEVKLQSLQIDQDLRAEVSGELREIREKIAELVERKVAAIDQLDRIDLRTPADGIVHELTVHTIGGVVEAGETLMLIVPNSDDLSIEVRIDAQDRDQIHVGQSAMLRMTAFNQRTTPELKGEVKVIAADLVEDPRSGLRYYPVRIVLLAGEEERLEGQLLTPGMPVESFVQTGYRTVISYLTKPLADYVMRAFRAD